MALAAPILEQTYHYPFASIRQALGHVTADTLILEAQFSFAPDTTMPAAAAVTVATAQSLYGNAAANTVRAAFIARGILQ